MLFAGPGGQDGLFCSDFKQAVTLQDGQIVITKPGVAGCRLQDLNIGMFKNVTDQRVTLSLCLLEVRAERVVVQ